MLTVLSYNQSDFLQTWRQCMKLTTYFLKTSFGLAIVNAITPEHALELTIQFEGPERALTSNYTGADFKIVPHLKPASDLCDVIFYQYCG
jgi:hypothetical protein